MKKTIPYLIILLLLLFPGCSNNAITPDYPTEKNVPVTEKQEELTFTTYTDSKYGFEFQYPSNWQIRQQPKQKGDALIISKDENYRKLKQNYFVIAPDVLSGTPISSVMKSKTDTEIDDVKATKELHLWSSIEEDTNNGFYMIYIQKNDRTIEYTIEYPSNNDPLYEKIIDSIKFI